MMKVDIGSRFRFVLVLFLLLTLSGCTDTTAPIVESTTPADGLTDETTNTDVSFTFSEVCDASAITADSFTLIGGGAPVGAR
jgi:PBP1b-binding outer membrane lipoprotein LpoB